MIGGPEPRAEGGYDPGLFTITRFFPASKKNARPGLKGLLFEGLTSFRSGNTLEHSLF